MARYPGFMKSVGLGLEFAQRVGATLNRTSNMVPKIIICTMRVNNSLNCSILNTVHLRMCVLHD